MNESVTKIIQIGQKKLNLSSETIESEKRSDFGRVIILTKISLVANSWLFLTTQHQTKISFFPELLPNIEQFKILLEILASNCSSSSQQLNSHRDEIDSFSKLSRSLRSARNFSFLG